MIRLDGVSKALPYQLLVRRRRHRALVPIVVRDLDGRDLLNLIGCRLGATVRTFGVLSQKWSLSRELGIATRASEISVHL